MSDKGTLWAHNGVQMYKYFGCKWKRKQVWRNAGRGGMCIDEESKEAGGEDRQGNVRSAGGEDQD